MKLEDLYKQEPLIDTMTKDKEHRRLELEHQTSNVPLAYYMKNLLIGKTIQNQKNKCAIKYPGMYNLIFSNVYWQTLEATYGTFSFLNAFYDEREKSDVGKAIRIVGMLNWIKRTDKRSYCQIWYEEESLLVISKIDQHFWIPNYGREHPGVDQPYLMTCKIPESHWKYGSPVSVSVVENPCDNATNNLRVIYNKPKEKKDFAVCVKGLDLPNADVSVKLTEWIELIGKMFVSLRLHHEFRT